MQPYHHAKANARASTLLPALAAVPGMVTTVPHPLLGPTARAEYTVLGLGPTGVDLLLPDGVDPAAIDTVLAAHNPATLSAGEVAAAQRTADATDLRDQAQQMITRADQIVAQHTAGFTAVQRDAAIRDLAVGVKRIVKYLSYSAAQDAGGG